MPTPDTLDLTTAVVADRQAVERDYLSMSFTQGRPERLALTMTVPKSWRVAEIKPSVPDEATPSVVVANLVSPDGHGSLTVTAFKLAREVAPADFLEAAISARGFAVRDKRDFASSYGRIADLVASGPVEGGTGWARAIAIKDGDLLFTLEGAVVPVGAKPANLDAFEDVFLLAAQSLSLVAPTKARFAEPYGYRAVGAQALTLVPDRWQTIAPPSALTALGVPTPLVAASPDDARLAFAATTDRAALEKIAAALIATLPQGVGQPQFVPTEAPDLLADGWTINAQTAERGGAEVRAVFASQGGVSAVLIAPGPGARMGVWPHALRVLEVALTSLGPAEPAP